MAAALGTLRDASKSHVFWILFATFFICGASTNGLVQVHLIPMCLDFGIPQVQAAGLLAAMGIFDFVGTIVSGWLSDRYDNRYLLFWYYGLRGLSLLFLPFTDFSFYGLSLFALFYGLDWIATVPPTVRLTAQRFGPERANLVFGWIFAGHQLGAGVAAFGAGLSRTVYLTYLPAFFVAGALCIVAALIVLAISRPAKTGGSDGALRSYGLSSCSTAAPACGAARRAARIRRAANASCGGRSPPRPRIFRPSGTASAAC